eukprot:gene767-770_t
MSGVSQISEFGKILIFLITGIMMVCFAFFINRLLAPDHPNPEKLSSYECEMVFVFPWAIVFGNHEMNTIDTRWGWLTLTEMFLFLGILIMGLIYVWVKGDLDWIKPNPVTPTTNVPIPKSLYEQLNLQQSDHKIRAFSTESTVAVPSQESVTTDTHGTPAVKKPIFGIACCAIEFMGAFASTYDLDRYGVFPRPSARQADVIIIAGTVTFKMAERIKRLYEQMPEPKYVISMGSCSNCGGPYWQHGYHVVKGVDRVIPVDVYVQGCPPRPESLIGAILELQKKIEGEHILKV